ncbi:TlpA family protein disulfide reductase [Sulfurimonas sp.]
MSKISILTTLLAATLIFQACSKDKNNEDTIKQANSMLSTNEFVLTSLDNKQYIIQKDGDGFKVKGADGKVLLLDIFATWCPPCQAEASPLASLQKKYPNDLQVIGITVENNIPNSKLEDFRHEHGANYTLVNSSENSRIIDEIAKKLKLGRDFGIPLMAMYKDGKLVNYYQGATEEEFIESDIKKALHK